MKALSRKRRALTLIEILAVVVILGIIALVVVPRVLVSAETSKTNACYQNKAIINTAVEQWYFNNGTWPLDDLSDIAANTDFFPEGIPNCPVDNSAYTLDAVTHRVTGHAH